MRPPNALASGGIIRSRGNECMKPRKAMKRLAKVEDLLSTVMDRLPRRSNGVGDLLATAKASVSRAKEELNSPPPSDSKKPPVTAQSEGGQRKSKGRRTEKSKNSARLKQTA